MHAALVFNPIAGKGKAAPAATVVTSTLEAAGHSVTPVDVGPEGQRDRLPEHLETADLLVILGGDGTVQANATIAARAGVPVYQWPLGTENLFAREFAMNRRAETLLGAIDHGRTQEADVGVCNGVPFLLMCSVGLDANIVHRLAAQRTGAISHLSYTRHILAELWRPGYTPLTLRVDGETIVHDRPGMIVVANCRQYALRIDPAKDASMSDGLLDAVFFPVGTRAGMLKWMALARARLQHSFRGSERARGRCVEILNHGSPVPYQLDGEAGNPEALHDAAPKIDLSFAPEKLKVLVPA